MIRYNTKRYWGYSTDTKPINAQIGDRFLEMDTQLEYVFSDYNKWELIGLNFTGGTVTGATIFTSGLTANTFSLSTTPNTNTTNTDVLTLNQSTGVIEQRSINSLINVVNLVTVGLTGSTGVDYNSIKTAVDSVTGASPTNTYVVKVGPGVFYEDPITMKSYVDVIGESETNTIIQANNPNTTLIIGADQSMISDVQIQGCTGTSVAAVVYSSATTPQLNAIFYVENVRFGTNYTHAKTVGTGGGNCIMQCSNVKYGGYPFTLGFYVTNDGSGVGRMQLRNVTSTNGGVTTTTGLIFAKADQPSCAFIVNGCLLTKSTGAAAGTGFWVENGGSLRLTAVNFQRWETAIYAPQIGSAPSIEAIALNFENCTTDVNIVHSGATGKIQGTDNYVKTLININAPLYEVNQDPRIITVAKKGGDFTSIKSAVDSITGSSSNNRFLVSVGPGRFSEGEIDLSQKPYISVKGSDLLVTEIVPNTNMQHIFKIGQYNELSFLSLSGASSGYAGIYVYDTGIYSLAHKLSFIDCDTNVWVESNTQDTSFYGEYLDFNGEYSYGTKTIAYNGYVALTNIENYYNFPTGTGTTIANSVQGSGATLSVFVGDGIGNGASGSTNYQIADYASLNTISTTSYNWGYSVRVINNGGPSRFDIDSLSIVDSLIWDLSIEHPGTFGTFGGGSASHAKINNLSNDVYWAFLDIEDGEFDITRKISITFQDNTHTDASTLIFKGGTMGLMSGGTISVVSGLTVNVSSGFGYLQKTTPEEVYMRIDWVGSNITLPQNVNYYLYYNENSILSTSGSKPDSVNNIILGRVVTNASTVSFIDEIPLNSDHTSNKYDSLFREALGPIYAFGSIVTEGTTPFTLDVTAGEYYFSTNEYLPTGGSGLTFNQYYRDGLGGWNISATTLVNNTQFDNNGILSGLTSSAYTKHTLYIVGEGANEKYLLVLGQNQYQTLVETEDALLPEPPSYFTDSVTQIANIYIRQGLSGITVVEDIRPVIGFKAGGVNASSLHANLLGLSSDDHTQYLLVNGNRQMSGNLGLGGNTIYSAGTINGVTIESHASRHKNGGADEIATSTPGASEIPKADTFGKLDGWISNASSSVKGLTRLSVDPLSAATPIAVGINDTRFLKTITGVTNTSGSLIFSNNSGETTSFSGLILGGLTATTISATTYQNLPATPFLPLSGGTVTGATNFTGGLTANTISATTFTSSTETIIGRIPTSATGSVSTGSGPYGIYVQGVYAYVVNRNSNTLQIIDVSNPSSPVSGGTVSTGNVPLGLYVQGRYAYVVNSNSNSLQIFDVSNPSSPVLVGSVSTGLSPLGLYVQGRYAYVVNGIYTLLEIFDVSNPLSPVSVGSVSISGIPNTVYVQGRYAYVGIGNLLNILEIFDISNPSSPVLVGSVSTSGNPVKIYVQGKYVYVVNLGSTELQIFNVLNPSLPVLVGTVLTSVNPNSVYVQGRYSYVVGSNSLKIIDVSNPSSPVSVGSVSTGSGPYGVYVQGRYAYVINYTSNTLQIFDVGGSYIQQLEAGGILTSTLESVGNATIGNDLAVVGGLNVSQSANILGNLSSTNMRVVSGLTVTTISATTYQNLPTDIRVTGATYSNNTFTYRNNTGGTFSVLFNTVTGLTVNGNLTVTGTTTSTTISATTYQNLPATPFLPLSGGTVTGATSFTNGLTANTISATTYQNLPTDIRVTGGTYSGSTIIFTNNTGGTFNVTGITTSSAFTGGTVSGATSFTGGLTANTISATTYQNLPATPFLPLSGGTVSGATSFTGGLTANTISATTITSPSISPYGLIVATSIGYQNIF
jgi:pectin methylesterase-like acyl-CoA thioesterase